MFIEEILNFFLQNIVFFIILLFGLSRFFRRTISSAGEEGKDLAPSPLPPVVKPFFDEKVERLDDQKVDSSQVQIKAIEKVEEPLVFDLDNSEEQPASLYLRVDEDVKNREQKSIAFNNPSKEELMNAVIWSEILGPPRAYKKHMLRR